MKDLGAREVCIESGSVYKETNFKKLLKLS